MNTDPAHNRCNVPEEQEEQVEQVGTPEPLVVQVAEDVLMLLEIFHVAQGEVVLAETCRRRRLGTRIRGYLVHTSFFFKVSLSTY